MKRITCLILIAVMLVSSTMINSALAEKEDFLSTYITKKAIKTDGIPLKVAINVAELDSEYIIALFDYLVWIFKKAGAEVLSGHGGGNVETQTNAIHDYIESGIDVLILHATDSSAMAPAVKACNEVGIKVICVNRLVEGDCTIDFAALANDQAISSIAADYIIKKASGKEVKVITLQGSMGTATAYDRASGFSANIEPNENIKIVSDNPCEWSSEAAMAAVNDALTANPDLFAVFSHSDCMIPGVISALTQSGKMHKVDEEGHVVVVSIDAAPAALKYVRDGYLDATVDQSPLILATIACKAVLTKIMNDEPLSGQIMYANADLVTIDNVDSAGFWGNYDSKIDPYWQGTENAWFQSNIN